MTRAPFRIERDPLTHPDVLALLVHHRASALRYSPECSVHALDAESLREPEVAFWTTWEGDTLLGMGALRALGDHEGEIKSMRVVEGHQGRGLGRAMLERLIVEARARGWQRISLETGSTDAFAPARALYEAAGFRTCAPFASYWNDPLSRCYAKILTADRAT